MIFLLLLTHVILDLFNYMYISFLIYTFFFYVQKYIRKACIYIFFIKIFGLRQSASQTISILLKLITKLTKK